MKEFSTRQLKIGQEIKSVLADIFMRGDMYDPKTLETLDITISEVQVSPDLRNATVYFLPLAGKNKERMEKILNPIAGKLKGQISRRIHTKRIPNLYFKLDNTFEKAQTLDDAIKKAEE